MRRLIMAGILIALGMAAVFVLYPYFMQERLIFYPQELAQEKLLHIRQALPEAEEVRLAAPDGVALHGWYVKGRGTGPSPLVIYFGGNAEEVSAALPEAAGYAGEGWSVVLMNYRGYGLSGGEPGERELFGDAEFIYDEFARREDVDAATVAVMGRSLGSGVAVYLASVRPVAGVVLVSPFDRLKSVARGHYPFLPVSWLLKHPFDSLSRAPNVTVPLLALVAGEDRVIPAEHSLGLAEGWGGDYTLRNIKGEGHNTISRNPLYREHIVDFLRELKGQDRE
jgi:pimeloyl-ACP methyl ester carboxylesterase